VTTEPPVYLTLAEIARDLGYKVNNIASIVGPWKNDPELPHPPPDAYYTVKDGHNGGLWLPERREAWRTWNAQRKILGRQRMGGRHPRNPVDSTRS
jgi:hypothetical protein